MFVTTLCFLLFGFPVAFTLAGSALIFAFIGDYLDIFNFRMLFFFPQRIYGIMINEALVAVPLFIFMGVLLEKTKIAAKLLESIGDLFGSVRGGLRNWGCFSRNAASSINRHSWSNSSNYGHVSSTYNVKSRI